VTQLELLEIRQVWLRNGGSPALSPIATGVSLAESNGWTQAISPVGDYGLWQINIANFGTYGLTTTSALDPNTNAQVAIAMSNNGRNWAPWCTCWTNPLRDCGHGYLPVPQKGSPAWDRLMGVNATLGTVTDTPPPAGGTPNSSAFQSAWNQVADLLGPYARSTYGTLSTINTQIGRLKP
jgi:hypothetical protein